VVEGEFFLELLEGDGVGVKPGARQCVGDVSHEVLVVRAVHADPSPAEPLPIPRRSSEIDEPAVIFVHKASGHVEQTPYADVSTLLERMRPVD